MGGRTPTARRCNSGGGVGIGDDGIGNVISGPHAAPATGSVDTMRIGDFPDTEERTRIEIEIFCRQCSKRVPGGIVTGKRYAESDKFLRDVEELKRRYLCGVCRDKKRREERREKG